jgi:hypothetical protein
MRAAAAAGRLHVDDVRLRCAAASAHAVLFDCRQHIQ